MNFLKNKEKNKDKDKEILQQEKDELPKVECSLIFEVLGKPPEHLDATLKDIIEKIRQEKGVEVVDEKINTSTELEKKPGFFTNFAEVDIKADNINLISALMFKYMPAHVDVISPEHLRISNNIWNELLNELTRRLHGYDEIARVIQYENKILKQKMQQMIELTKTNQDSKEKSNLKKKTLKKKASKKR